MNAIWPRLIEGRRHLARGEGFEAHEVWEEAWRPLPPGAERRSLQGLIQLAVALEHRRRGNPRGAAGQWAKAKARLEGGLPWPLLDLPRLLHDVAPCLDAAARGELADLPDLGWLEAEGGGVRSASAGEGEKITPTLMLIHGAWMNAESWEGWRERYEARGYRVVAPSWPGDERPAAELRASPSPELANVGVAEIVAHYQAEAAAVEGPLVLIGHSFGGLFVQMLLDRGVGVAGVAIDPAPPRGVLPAFNALRAGLPTLLSSRAVVSMSFADFQWGWAHTQPEAEQRAAWERYVVPMPKKVYADGANAPFTRTLAIDFASRKQPLLLIAGGADRTVPASMVRATFALQKKAKATTDLHEFPDRTHWLVGAPGWEEIADDAITWVEKQLPAGPG
jgi:pimeloyl-ACP methyl ester carboxylesterase